MLSLERGVTNEPFSVRNDFTLNAQAYAEKRLSQVLGNTANFEISDSIEATPVNSASSVVTTTQTETASTAAIVKQSIDYFTAREAAFRAATSATAFHTAKQLLLSGKDAKTVENLTYIASSGTLSAEETFETDATTAAPLSPVSNSAAYDAGYGIMTLTAEPEWDPSKFIQSPATIELNEQENINMYTGGVRYTKNLVSIPGENGMDLVLDLKYDSDEGRHGVLEYMSSSVDTKTHSMYDIGVGWSFDLPYWWNEELYIPGKGKYQVDGGILNHELDDIYIGGRLSDAERPAWLAGVDVDAVVHVADGCTYYFASHSMLDSHLFVGVEDLWGNYIQCTYYSDIGEWKHEKLSSISNSNGKTISFSYNQTESKDRNVVITRPDNESITLELDIIESRIIFDTSRTYDWCCYGNTDYCYTLSSVILPDEGAINFNYNTYFIYPGNDLTGSVPAYDYTVLCGITYPSNTQSWYTYDTIDVGAYGGSLTTYMSMQNHYTQDGAYVFNYVDFEHRKYTDDNLQSRFTFDEDAILTEIEQYVNVSTTDSPTWELCSRTEYTRDTNHLITKIVTTEFDGDFSRVSIENYTYNSFGAVTNAWSIFAEGDTSEDSLYKTSYIYEECIGSKTVHTICIQKCKLYKLDAHTTVTEESVLNDVLLPSSIRILENDTVVSKTDYTYDTNGNVISIKKYPDVTNTSNYILNEITYENGTSPQTITVSGVKDPDGISLGTNGNLTTSYTYDTMWNNTFEIHPDNRFTRYSYDKSRRVTGIARMNSQFQSISWVYYHYNLLNNTTTYNDPSGASYVYQYNILGDVVSITNPMNILSVQNVYDTHGNIAISSNALGANTRHDERWEYDAFGRNVTYTMSPYAFNTQITKTVNTTYTDIANTAGDSWVVTKNGGQSAYEWDNKLTPLNIETYTYYNKYGQKTYEGTTGGTETAYTYDHLGRVLTEVSPTVHNTYTYDALGRVISVKNKQNNTATNEYDDLGRLIRTTDFLGAETLYTYDALDRVIITQVEQSDNVYMTTKNYYDMSGNLFQVLTSAGTAESPTWNTTRYEYDELDRLTKQTVGDIVTEYTYDALGNILTQKTGGVGTTYTYDALGRMLTSTDALGKTEYYVYDNNGYLIQKTDRKGNVHNMTYNILGRLISESGPDYAKTYDYYATGAIAKITQGEITQTYTYDNAGRLLMEAMMPDGITKRYTYNAAGLRNNYMLQVRGYTHMNTSYAYDAMGQLTAVYDNGTEAVTYAYDGAGRCVLESKTNDVTVSYTYNNAGQLLGMTNTWENVVYSNYQYTYGLDGNRRTETNGSTTKTYDYYQGMLSNESVYENGVTVSSKIYGYDNRGNRSYSTVFAPYNGGASYTYDANNRLTSSSETVYNESTGQTETVNSTYTYDDNGNLIEKTAGNAYTMYNYNALNQLSNVINDGSHFYTYYPDGMRYKKTVNGVTTTQI